MHKKRIFTDTDTETADSSEVTLDPLTAQAENETDNTGEAVFVNADATQSDTYFVQAKLDREQSRAKQKDMLTEMINSSEINNEQKQEFADGILEIQQRIEKETASEKEKKFEKTLFQSKVFLLTPLCTHNLFL